MPTYTIICEHAIKRLATKGHTMKTVKGTPTDMNLRTLYGVMVGDDTKPFNAQTNIYQSGIVGAGSTVFANALCSSSAAGLRRCLKFGLVTVEGKSLRLTELGESAMCGWAMDFGRSFHR